LLRDEEHTVQVPKDNILPSNHKISNPRGNESIGSAYIQSSRSSGACPVAEDRETDLLQLGRVAVSAPDDDPSKSITLGFQSRQIADAAFVHPAAVVNHQYIAWLRYPHGFQEDVYTAVVLHRENAPGKSEPG
jgi:hypothetical protein